MNENLNKDKKDISLEIYDKPKHQNILPTHIFIAIQATSVSLTPLVFSTPPSISSSKPGKYSCRRPDVYLIQINLLTVLNICFIIDNLYYNNINMRLLLYILSRQKLISILLEKRYSRMLTQKMCQLV